MSVDELVKGHKYEARDAALRAAPLQRPNQL